jgi:hypothetical protein
MWEYDASLRDNSFSRLNKVIISNYLVSDKYKNKKCACHNLLSYCDLLNIRLFCTLSKKS